MSGRKGADEAVEDPDSDNKLSEFKSYGRYILDTFEDVKHVETHLPHIAHAKSLRKNERTDL